MFASLSGEVRFIVGSKGWAGGRGNKKRTKVVIVLSTLRWIVIVKLPAICQEIPQINNF